MFQIEQKEVPLERIGERDIRYLHDGISPVRDEWGSKRIQIGYKKAKNQQKLQKCQELYVVNILKILDILGRGERI